MSFKVSSAALILLSLLSISLSFTLSSAAPHPIPQLTNNNITNLIPIPHSPEPIPQAQESQPDHQTIATYPNPPYPGPTPTADPNPDLNPNPNSDSNHGPPPQIEQCTTGDILCCNSFQQASAVSGLLAFIPGLDANALVSTNCSPVTVIGPKSGRTWYVIPLYFTFIVEGLRLFFFVLKWRSSNLLHE